MAIQSAAGATMSIGTTVAATTASEYAADTYAAIGNLESIGEFGDAFNPVTFTGLSDSRVQKFKGSADAGDVSFTYAFDAADAGQVALIAAHAASASYNVRIAFSGGEIRYFKAQIMSLKEGAPNADSIMMVNGSMSINTAIVQV